jgi:DNA polymerase elongation subunit (family B)
MLRERGIQARLRVQPIPRVMLNERHIELVPVTTRLRDVARQWFPIEYTGDVYDLTTECHHFAAGVGSLIVHNTDSVYVQLKHVQLSDAGEYWTMAERVEDKLKDYFKGTTLKLAFEEKIYKNFYIAHKKHYITETITQKHLADASYPTNIDSKGVILARRDSCEFVCGLFKRIVHYLFNDNTHTSTIDQCVCVYDMIYEHIRNHLTRKYPLSDYVYTGSFQSYDTYKPKPINLTGTSLKKMGTHYTVNRNNYQYYKLPAAAHVVYKRELRGEQVVGGSRIPFVYVRNPLMQTSSNLCTEDVAYVEAHPDVYQLDYLQYIKRCITPVDTLCQHIFGSTCTPMQALYQYHKSHVACVEYIRSNPVHTQTATKTTTKRTSTRSKLNTKSEPVQRLLIHTKPAQ